ncbi:unnamed protein product [Phaedon cochleariae]|uniref:C2H2-type domain-containing protein n=1 Tax=Phaedon cochleariae TaxID=80249 RepID=A0A9P0DET4_PHACE|nr:unnamed protein product [Phaedon cochleariae]
MSRDTFESKTFSKNMGEDSDEENSEEDIDEMIMNINYFQKQNKSSEPSVICDPLMLDPTNMSENTIKLIRIIEENLNKSKMIQNLEIPGNNNVNKIQQGKTGKSETGPQIEHNQPIERRQVRRGTGFENSQQINCGNQPIERKQEVRNITPLENSKQIISVVNDKLNQPIKKPHEVKSKTPLENSKQIVSVVNDKFNQPIKKKHEVRNETPLKNSKQIISVVNDKLSQPIKRKYGDSSETRLENNQEIIYVEDDEPKPPLKQPVKRVCTRKKAQTQSKFKNFWSPGNVQVSKVENKSIVEKPTGNLIDQQQNKDVEENFQDPSVIETNANKLLKDIAKDIEEYKKRALPKLGKLVKPLNETSTVIKNTSQYEDQMTKKVVGESEKQKMMNEKQENPNDKSKAAITHPVVQEPLCNSIFRCSLCYKKVSTYESLQEHLKFAHKDKICLCVLCNRAFTSREGLKNHHKSKHINIFSNSHSKYFQAHK